MSWGWILILAVEAAIGVAVSWAVTKIGRTVRGIAQEQAAIRDVVCGQPADPWRGEDEVPGIATRMRAVEERTRQLVPNGGSHLADAVNRTEVAVATLTARYEDHVRNHPGPGAP